MGLHRVRWFGRPARPQDLADGARPAGGLRQRQVRLDGPGSGRVGGLLRANADAQAIKGS